MTPRPILAALGLLLTAGCASDGNAYRDPAATADHPANPGAAAAPAPEPFTTLALGDAPAPQADPHDAHAGHGDPHAGHAAAPASQPAAAGAAYVCPMHPKVTSATQGICPKCEMKLEKAPAPAAGQAATAPAPAGHDRGGRP